jgi:hypothetical protein
VSSRPAWLHGESVREGEREIYFDLRKMILRAPTIEELEPKILKKPEVIAVQ